MAKTRKHLSAKGLLNTTFNCFSKISDTVTRKTSMNLTDCLMSGLAVFSMKYPSLLQFEKSQAEAEISHNLKALYKVKRVPSDTYMRERLDEIKPSELRAPYKSIFADLQRGKVLEQFSHIDDHYLLSLDGTGYFSSHDIHCESCCEKHHRNGQTTYYHQMLGAALVHPDLKQVIPFAPEPILKQDGKKKNDCERNAAKRLLETIRREHPPLKLTIIEDGLASNAPHINLLRELKMQFILGAKSSDHKFLFEWVGQSTQTKEYQYADEKGITHRFRYLNHAPLNNANCDCEINFLEYWEVKPNGKQVHFSWVTDISLNENNIISVMKGGRARWKIENETFNTLKNQGYHFEHNFGHGKQHLSTVFAHLMLLAFLIDQVQELTCHLFQHGIVRAKGKKRFWEKLRGFFLNFLIHSWDELMQVMAYGKKPVSLFNDTS